MRTLKNGMWMVLAVLLLAAVPVRAQEAAAPAAEESEPWIAGAVSVDVATDYVWRGIKFRDEAVVQPSITLSSHGFYVNWWGNFNATDEDIPVDQSWSEHDFTVGYDHSFGPLTLGAGVIYYYFPQQPTEALEDTMEVFGKASLDVLLTPTLAVYYDTDEAQGVYANLGVSHSFDLTEKLTFGLGAGVGWASAKWANWNYGTDDAGLADLSGRAALSYALTDYLSFTAYVAGSAMIDGDFKDAFEAANRDENNLWGGINATFSF